MSASMDRVAMSRGLALLFGAGATLVLITLVLPHGHDEAQLGLLIPAGLAYAVAALLLAAPSRYPPGVLNVILALGTLLIGVCVLYSSRAGPAYAFMYVWVALYAAAFLTLAGAVGHLTWALASYIGVLAISGDVHPPAAMWLMAAGTSTVAAALIFGLTRELRARADDLAAVTALANSLGSASEVSADAVSTAVCEGVLRSTGAVSVVLLEELADGSGLHVAGEAGGAAASAPFATPEGVAVLDRAYRSGAPAELIGPRARRHAGTVAGFVQPVLREGRVGGLLKVVWAPPRRRVSSRVSGAVALFAAEAGVALERIARQSRERERRALELNDEIVQGLVVAKYALRDGRVEIGEKAIAETLDRARALVDGQLESLHGADAPEPGTLRREGRGIG
jgi:hypothetical protein